MSVIINLNGRTFELPSDIEVLGDTPENQLIKLNLSRGGDSEGIWAAIHEIDVADYESTTFDNEYTRVCVLLNHALAGIPWGAYVPYKLQGDSRPVAVFEEIINIDNDPVYFPDNVRAEYEKRQTEGSSTDETEG